MTEGHIHPASTGDGPSSDWEALARHLAGESTPEESARIEAALAEHPGDRDVLAALDKAMSSLGRDADRDVDVEAALIRVKARMNAVAETININAARSRRASTRVTSTPGWRVPFPAIAAVGLFAVGAISWIGLRDRQPRQTTAIAPRMLATGVGVRDSLTLSDGTRVILGPLSSISMKAGYGSENREVEIRGDAWFEVVHDQAKPFTVRAGAATIVDVGTRFAVRSDAADGVSVSVTEGSVSLRPSNIPEPQSVVLKAGDAGLLDKTGRVIARRGAVTDDDIAWMHGRIVFREASMGEVVASLRRWYGIELRVDPSLANRHITATFSGESLDRALEVLRLALGAEIERRGDSAVIRPTVSAPN